MMELLTASNRKSSARKVRPSSVCNNRLSDAMTQVIFISELLLTGLMKAITYVIVQVLQKKNDSPGMSSLF